MEVFGGGWWGATVKEESPAADGENFSRDLLLQFMSTEVAAQ